MAARELYLQFIQAFPYIYISIDVVEQYLAEGHNPDIWLLQDYILSQDLADEVVE